MTTKPGPHHGSRLAAFIRQRVQELEPRKNQGQIAREAGYLNVNVLSMAKNGHTKVALDRLAALADALEADRVHVLNLGLEQAGLETVQDVIQKVMGVLPTENEGQWLEALREASDHSDPVLSKRARVAVFAIFGR
jgi:hypothetical protein